MPTWDQLSTFRKVLLYICLPLNALSAGGIFCFPLFAPSLASHLNLSQSQLSTIVLAGMMGQYPLAAFWGMFIDRVGTWATSLSAGVLFATSYGLFSWKISQPSAYTSPWTFVLLVFFFFLAGLGTVASYFSCLFSASKTFPTRTGLAMGVITSLFGLSPMFLSSIGTIFFPDPHDGLDAPHYLLFLAIFCGGVNILGGYGLRAIPRTPEIVVDSLGAVSTRATSGEVEEEGERTLRNDEETPLLPNRGPSPPPREHEKLHELLRDADFWVLAFVMLVCMGMSEMIISNIGTIVASLEPSHPATSSSSSSSSSSAAAQVRLLSLANTFSRLLTGPIADFTSPIPIRHQPTGELVFHPKRAVSRVAFVWLTCVLLMVGFGWMCLGEVGSVEGVWFLSVMTGSAYGMIWTVVPSITECVWGSRNAARNFGTISYSPFIGTPIFTFLYAFMSDRARDRHNSSSSSPSMSMSILTLLLPEDAADPMCRGTSCWRGTFFICEIVVLGAFCMATVLWRRWGNRV